MITFTTLFLGFIAGARPVELAVDAAVAAVELRLDGRQVAALDGPPWRAEVDFGDELLPHRLEALAFDQEGRLLERLERRINLARADYEAAIALDDSRRGGRLRWAAVLDQQPASIDLRFDGRPLAIDAGGGFRLPPYDPAVRHALEAVLVFPDGHRLATELTFGGVFGERVTSALTAVPVTSPAGRPWPKEALAGCFLRDGRALPVFATSAGAGRLLVVRDERLGPVLKRLRRQLAGRSLAGPAAIADYAVAAISPRPLQAHDRTFKLLELGAVDPFPGLGALLLSGQPLTGRDARRRRRQKEQKLWDALAVAGRDAAASDRPRAVLLMTGSDPRDHSTFSLEQAARYLASVHVPLFLWTPDDATLGRLPPLPRARPTSGARGLEALVDAIPHALASQTIVWLEGEHLPAEIAVSPTAPPGLELVR
ncbi:MAG: hypothetical protein D6696_04585 [Acidobacteria bacterium]|nr:MAG: hypothetical protein D6696_04585 [Acidobacteriota bacterium]